MSLKKSIISLALSSLLLLFIAVANGNNPGGLLPGLPFLLPEPDPDPQPAPGDSIKYPLEEREGDFISNPSSNPFDLNDPKDIEQTIEFDPETNTYIVTETVGGQDYRPPTYLSFDEFWSIQNGDMQQQYWDQKSNAASLLKPNSLLNPQLKVDSKLFEGIFGGSTIDIRPTGSIDMEFGFTTQNIDNPALLESVRRQGPNFLFDMDINMGVVGKIGDRMNLNINYNTRSVFNFDNQIKLEYVGDEDEIIQELKAGNVDFPLPTQLIPGSQSLFGFKTKLKFGRLTVTSVISQQKSKTRQITIENGAQLQEFEVFADQYDANRHFFLSHYFRDNYEQWLRSLPYVGSPITITRVDVYINDTRATPQDVQRDIVGLTDLGEANPFNNNITTMGSGQNPRNEINNLNALLNSDESSKRLLDQVTLALESAPYNLQDIRDFKKTTTRKLDPDEFVYDAQMGFISLNFALRPNEVLAVAYEYVDATTGQKFDVGEFSEDIPPADSDNQPRVMYLKMLKTSTALVTHPIWDLMMKNVYALGAYQVQQQDFELDIYYENPGGGDLRYIPQGEGIKGCQLIRLMSLDRLNTTNDLRADGIFDFILARKTGGSAINTSTNATAVSNAGTGFQGNTGNVQQPTTISSNGYEFGTINPRNGRLIFPVLEPFGDHLRAKFTDPPNNNTEELANQYVYDYLYDSTKTVAADFPEFNRFVIRGTYKSSVSSEISLGAFNIPRNSITVTAGGQVLTEGTDYTVDYNLGRLTILNEAYVNAGIPVNVNFEDNATFGLQQRTFMGTRMDFQLNKDVNFGGTVVRLSERPFTRKVNYGDDPIANSMVGLDMNAFDETPWLTKALDKLPGIDTKEPSSITFNAEGAGFLPGHARAIGTDGTVYIDDFEGANTGFDIRFPRNAWMLASTPKDVPVPDDINYALPGDGSELFPEAEVAEGVEYGYNRAKLAWYQVDNVFYSDRADDIPPGTTNRTNHYVRNVNVTDVFPTRSVNIGANNVLPFDMAFYPSEKGPYNYDVNPSDYSAGIMEDGTLIDPQTRWGGIMRDSPIKDFEEANVEFIEFWMLDPFIYDPTDPTNPLALPPDDGYLYLQIGNVSEDILKDARAFYENGLPAPEEVPNLDQTQWGNVPIVKPITNAFDTDEAARAAQDVGFDGLNDEQEQEFHVDYLNAAASRVNAATLEQFRADPSNDNFRYFRDSLYTEQQSDILERYKNFSNPENNSPAQGNSNARLGFTTIPDIEDFNQDDALNDSESYFEYRIHLKEALQIGEEFLIDTLIDPEDGSPDAKWLHFIVPIDKFTNKVGNVNFRNIEGIRMFLTGFERPVVCRFAEIDLVRGTWRRYRELIREPGEYVPANNDNEADPLFNVSVVSIEENSQKSPIGYVLPPGVVRDRITGTTQTLEVNEQAISVQIAGLPDGEGKAIYKRLDMDMRAFKRLQLFVHAEQLTSFDDFGDCNSTESNDLTAFIRLGDDFHNNYYEYEIPLHLTNFEEADANPDPGNSDNPCQQKWVWPQDNLMDIRLDSLVNLKLKRNFDPNASVVKPYSKFDTIRVSPLDLDGYKDCAITDSIEVIYKMTVVGSPDLGRVKRVMMGVRNPKRSARNLDDDGQTKCAEVWFNELRLVEFDEGAGWAAIARADVKLADIGNLTVAGNMHTAGFGTLEQKVHERFRDNLVELDVSANLELSKFLPEGTGIRIPMFAGMSQSVSTPEFDPYDTDVKLGQLLDSIRVNEPINPTDTTDYLLSDSERVKKAKKQRQTASKIKSVNFTGVRKERTNTEKKPMPYDIENFTGTYAFTNTDKRTPILESDNEKKHVAALDYNYNARPVYITPFKKLIKSRSKYLSLIKDFNFNLIPSNINFRTDWERQKRKVQLRKLGGETVNIKTTHDNYFYWDRGYGFKYNPARSITIDYNATNLAVIDEAIILTDTLNNTFEVDKDSLWTNFKKLGRTTSFNHTAGISYNLPLDKIPFLSWTQVRSRYGATYNWKSNPVNIADTLGNTIDNTQQIQINTELNFTKLYNSIPFLKALSSTRSNRKKPKVAPKAKPKDGDKDKKKKKTKSTTTLSPVVKALLRPLVSIKRVSINYNQGKGTIIPGFMFRPDIFGFNRGAHAPGFGFMFGAQPQSDWFTDVAEKGWISDRPSLNEQVIQYQDKTMNFKANVEPIKDFKIDVNMSLSYDKTHREFFKVDQAGIFDPYNPASNVNEVFRGIDEGSYSISHIMLKTAFDKIDTASISATFKQFDQNISIISKRLQNDLMTTGGDFTDPFEGTVLDSLAFGYGGTNNDVLIPAFLAAYSGRDANTIKLNAFTHFPLPNWRITYNGLSKLKPFKELFNSFNLTHSYASTVSISSFRSDLDFEGSEVDRGEGKFPVNWFIDEVYGIPMALDSTTGNFYSLYIIPDLSVTENFAPFLGVDITFKNGLTTRFDYNRSRTLGMSFRDYQLSERQSSEFVFGLGYRVKGLKLPFKFGGKEIELENDLSFNLDFSIRDDRTVIYRLLEKVSEPASGTKTIRIAPSIDYTVSKQLRVSLFYDRTKNIPATSASFPITNSRGGIRINFSLSQ